MQSIIGITSEFEDISLKNGIFGLSEIKNSADIYSRYLDHT